MRVNQFLRQFGLIRTLLKTFRSVYELIRQG
jgi:hypothetical protein